MLTVDKRMPQGRGLSAVLVKRAAEVSLTLDERRQPQAAVTDSAGRALQLRLPEGTVLRGGDVLVAEDGSLVRVVARPQPVMVVTACREHGTPADLARAAWLLARRGVAVDIRDDRLHLAPDDAVAVLLRGRHLDVDGAVAPFEPESEEAPVHAHGHAHGHGHHAHGHDHGHDHGHGHGHGHGHDHDHAAHVHGEGCGHDHDHHHAPAAQPVTFHPRKP